MPVENLHRVPDNITDQEACFTEPLAAACRIVEQQVTRSCCKLHLTTVLSPAVLCPLITYVSDESDAAWQREVLRT